jgi:hypothetical protein
VPDGLPADLRVGLFATPGSYNGHIRFANATSESDKDQDIRGMSIKLTGVPEQNLMPGSTEHDFVLFSHPVMLASTAKEFLELLKANEARGLRRITYFATHPKSRPSAPPPKRTTPVTSTSRISAPRRTASGPGRR